VLAEEAQRLAGDVVLAGPYGPAVREALDDREAVRAIVRGLGAADRALLPVADVDPTVNGLVDRVGELAQRLHAIDRDAAPGALDAVDARLRQARAAASTAEAERTVALLERQRDSLAELTARRDELAARFESARAALRTLRLDFLKLREGGVGALGAGSATQEARALSRDIGYALEAAGEVRGR
jgi:serine/threonine-protein kinase